MNFWKIHGVYLLQSQQKSSHELGPDLVWKGFQEGGAVSGTGRSAKARQRSRGVYCSLGKQAKERRCVLWSWGPGRVALLVWKGQIGPGAGLWTGCCSPVPGAWVSRAALPFGRCRHVCRSPTFSSSVFAF